MERDLIAVDQELVEARAEVLVIHIHLAHEIGAGLDAPILGMEGRGAADAGLEDDVRRGIADKAVDIAGGAQFDKLRDAGFDARTRLLLRLACRCVLHVPLRRVRTAWADRTCHPNRPPSRQRSRDAMEKYETLSNETRQSR